MFTLQNCPKLAVGSLIAVENEGSIFIGHVIDNHSTTYDLKSRDYFVIQSHKVYNKSDKIIEDDETMRVWYIGKDSAHYSTYGIDKIYVHTDPSLVMLECL